MTALCLAAGAGLGWLIDSRLQTAPAFTIVGLAIGIVLAILLTVRLVRTYLRT
jgi:F0F1-type ATP synthase assembly protein I